MTGATDTAKPGNPMPAPNGKEDSMPITERIAIGTEKLSEEARQRVIAARRKAIDARKAATQQIRQGSDMLSDAYDRQPLVFGALALAAGAAIAGALPKSRAEDQYFGDTSDHLFEEADRIFREETAKLQSVVNAARDEAANIAGEIKSDMDNAAPGEKGAYEAMADSAKAAGARVAKATLEKADDEGLGKPKI